MNAVERLWRALRKGDWASLRAQLDHGAVIERLDGSRLAADEYVAAARAAGVPEAVDVRRITGDGTVVAVEAAVVRSGARFRVLAIYDLHTGRIAGGTEAWARDAR